MPPLFETNENERVSLSNLLKLSARRRLAPLPNFTVTSRHVARTHKSRQQKSKTYLKSYTCNETSCVVVVVVIFLPLLCTPPPQSLFPFLSSALPSLRRYRYRRRPVSTSSGECTTNVTRGDLYINKRTRPNLVALARRNLTKRIRRQHKVSEKRAKNDNEMLWSIIQIQIQISSRARRHTPTRSRR